MREQVGGERHVGAQVEQPASALVQSHDAAARAHRDDALVERIDDGRQERVLRLERRQPRRELFGHALKRGGEVAHFAGRGEGGAALEVSGGDRGGNVAELDDRLRHRARETERDDQRAGQREQSGGDHVVARAVHDRAEFRRTDGDPDGPLRMLDGEVELVVAGRRAAAPRRADAVLARLCDFGSLVVILELFEVVAAELRVSNDLAVRSDERHAPAERGASRVGERIVVHAGVPLAADEPRLAFELRLGLAGEPVREPVSGDQDDDGDEQDDDDERSQQQPLGETHTRRA